MMQWIVIAVVSGAAGLLMLDGDEPPPPPVVAAADFNPLSTALFWVGGCSVTCSLIGAFTLVKVTRLKRRDQDGHHR